MFNLIKNSIIGDLKSKADWNAINWFKCASLGDKIMFIIINVICCFIAMGLFLSLLNLIYYFIFGVYLSV